jgi:CubicO group peptidase (beta-lactamase class C family)
LSTGRAVVYGLCATVLGLILVGKSPQVACGQPAPAVDSIGQALVENHPGGAVIGLLRGDTTAVHAFGTVDSTGRSPTARTVFEIGSVTKTFTGLLLADAIERDELELSTPVGALLPDSVSLDTADSTTVTLGHLATHRSGLPRLPANLGATARPWDPYAAYGDSALYAFLDGRSLPRAPETSYQYSNLGAGLLGHLLARRADTTYAALVRRRITGPLGLADTRTRLTDAQRLRFAQGHTRTGASTSPWHFDALAGAGALRSTPADLLSYLRAHRRALTADPDTATTLHRAMRRATTVHAPTDRENTRVALGWHQSTREGHEVLWHNGGTGGFRSLAALDRDTGHGVVVLVSAALSSRRVLEAGMTLLRILRSD